MKTMKFILFAAITFAAIACVKEPAPGSTDKSEPVNLVPMTFTASSDEATDVNATLPSAASTRLALESGRVVWKVNDKIMVISSNGVAEEFTATSVSDDGKSATFEGLTENANEYYAVYPASAYKGTPEYVTAANGGSLLVQVPEVQQAVAGTFHPSAILCIANTKGKNFTFKHSCAFLKFRFADPEGVKSVCLKVNKSDNVAGIGYVGVNATDLNPKYSTSDPNQYKSDMITLNAPDGGFVAGEYYYIAMRANICENGITAYIEYEDKVMSRSSTSQVFVPVKDENDNVIMSGSIGKIKNLGQIDKDLSTVSPYDTYQLGFDLTVAGKTINKNTYSDATLISAESSSKVINNGGVYFVDTDVPDVTLGAGINNKSIIVIGNSYDGRARISRTNFIPLPSTDEDDHWILANISLNISNSSGYTLRANTSKTVEYFAFDKCDVNIPTGQQFIYIAGTDEVKNIRITNSEFLVGPGSTNNFIKADKTHTIDNIILENNVFYSADPEYPATAFALISKSNATVQNLIVNKNTMYGAMGTLFTASPEKGTPLTYINIENCTITNNMFVVQEISGGNVSLVNRKIKGSMNVTNNRCWMDNNNDWRIGGVAGTYQGTGTAETPGSLTPSEPNWDPVNGKFLLHKSFGATR